MSASLPGHHNIGSLLTSLVHRLERDDIATVEALLTDVVGNRVAAQMLRQLMRWWTKSTNLDGWVYKSHVDWWAELRIKQNELPAANGALERVGVEIKLMKAEGAPTKHYRLDIKRFLTVVASTLSLTVKKLAGLLKNAFAERVEMDLTNGSKSITTTPTTNPPTDNAAVLNPAASEALKVRGVSEYTARNLVAQHGPERVIGMVRIVLAKQWKNPAGALIKGLRDQWECKPMEANSAFQGETEVVGKWADDPTPLPPAPVSADPEATLPDRETAEWAKIHEQLKVQIDPTSFNTWVRETRLGNTDGDCWTIYAPNAAARDMLQWRIARDIQQVVQCLTQRSIELFFEVDPARIPASMKGA